MHVLPQLRRLEAEFGDALSVIGVHSPKFPAEHLTENVRQAVLRNEIDHPVVNDADMAIWQSYGVSAWPTLMFIDPLGKVFASHAGEFSYPAMRNAVAMIIEGYRDKGLLDSNALSTRPEQQLNTTLRYPGKVIAAEEQDRLFIADSGHHQIVAASLSGEIVARFGSGAAGFRDGPPVTAMFSNPQGLAGSEDGRYLYVADAGNHALRAIDLRENRVQTLAGNGQRGRLSGGGMAGEVSLASPWDLGWHGGKLWIAMAGMHQLWTFDPGDWSILPAAGTGAESIHDGPLLEATFAQPMGIAGTGDRLYIADSESSAVRQVDPLADRVRRIVGRGLFHFGDLDARGDSVRLQHVQGIDAVTDGENTVVYLADSYNNKIKRLDPATRSVKTVAGDSGHGYVDGPPDEAMFWEPTGLSGSGNMLYIADTNNHAIRWIDLEGGLVETLIR